MTVLHKSNVCIFRWKMGTQNILDKVAAGILWKYGIVLKYTKGPVSKLFMANGQSRYCGPVRGPHVDKYSKQRT